MINTVTHDIPFTKREIVTAPSVSSLGDRLGDAEERSESSVE